MTVNGLSYQVLDGRFDEFWSKVERGAWEPDTFVVFDRCLSGDVVMVDVGAWIGPTVLYGAQLARRCIAFEPDPVAFEHLRANIAANRSSAWTTNITMVPAAVTSDGESLVLGNRGAVGDSMSSALFGDQEQSWPAAAAKLDRVIEHHIASRAPIFVKIDIEGGEYDLLPALAELLARPHVSALVSLHPQFLLDHLVATKPPSEISLGYVSSHERVLRSLPWDSHRISYPAGQELSAQSLADRFDHNLSPYELVIEPRTPAGASRA